MAKNKFKGVTEKYLDAAGFYMPLSKAGGRRSRLGNASIERLHLLN
jgi:hypothetical protein